jgi:hypothetical protein
MPTFPVKRLSLKAICLAAVTFTTVAVTAGVAWAAYTDNMFPTQNQLGSCRSESGPDGNISCQTDNSALNYYTDASGTNALEAGDKSVVVNVLQNIYGPTDLTVSFDSTPAFSGSAETDIVFEESAVGLSSSTAGATFCNNAADTLACDQQYVRIRGGGYYTTGVTCHETGHAVGLLHGAQAAPKKANNDEALGCMETPTDSFEVLDANNISNINSTY